MHIYLCPSCKINSEWCIQVEKEAEKPEDNLLRCYGCGWKGVLRDLTKYELGTIGGGK